MMYREDFDNYSDYRKALVRESQRKRRETAAKMGKCHICCRNTPEVGRKTCSECRARVIAYQKAVRGAAKA